MTNRKILRPIEVLLLLAIAVCVAAQVAPSVIGLEKDFAFIEYRPDLGIPQSVQWTVSRADIGRTKRDPSFRFKSDKSTPKPHITSDLYTRSGWQRGHMCPAADRSVTKAQMKSTFIMSNVCPMTPALNTGAWKITENMERSLALQYGSCSVVAAPLFFPQDTSWLGGRRVAVPHAFMKFITIPGRRSFCKCYILSNL